tara:strand:+ start:103 stop:516 length:414 start_codon:yes stop_codon:yes gene_type:complete
MTLTSTNAIRFRAFASKCKTTGNPKDLDQMTRDAELLCAIADVNDKKKFGKKTHQLLVCLFQKQKKLALPNNISAAIQFKQWYSDTFKKTARKHQFLKGICLTRFVTTYSRTVSHLSLPRKNQSSAAVEDTTGKSNG